MKTFLKTFVIFSVMVCFAACSEKNQDYMPPVNLEVTPHNMSGYWELTELNGSEIPEGTFCYIEYIRRDRKFIMYQKFDSMYPRRITGVYTIEKDNKKGYILSGIYDFGMGEWNKYIVSELLENSMVLTMDSDEAEISKYKRCNEIPAEVLEEAK